ncbi:TPA: hypothetical protein ACH3X2_001931 [Trebouxia sp. C0005]
MTTPTEAGEVSKQLLTEPASASLSELPYAPSLSFGQVPNQAEQSQPMPSQSSYLQFDGLVQNYQALAADLQLGSLGRPSSSAAASSTMLQPPEQALSGTQQAMLAAQHAMATARYSAPSHTLMHYPIATPSNLDQSEAEPGLTLTGELQQAITQSSGYPADAVPGNGEVPLDPSRPLAQEDDQASVETQDLNMSPGTKKGRLRRSVRKKRAREGGEQTSRKAPTPITLAVTPVLAAITQAQPIQCLEGENQDCPELIIQSTTPEDIMETAKNFLMEQTKQGSPKGRKTRPQEALAKVLALPIVLAVLAQYPIAKAARELGVGETCLKSACRQANIKRWPHRAMQSVAKLSIDNQYSGVCKEEADRMRLGLPLSGEFRKTRQKKYKEKHEQGRIAATGLCMLRGKNGTPEGDELGAEQSEQHLTDQQLDQQVQQQPDPAASDAALPVIEMPAVEVIGQAEVPVTQAEAV